ncbi:fucoxanthin chl a/c light-harvesting protein [Tribonema minus]|uniref:Fucoxanthin chl a/c light-harvesting protein n=1 Tax=Tribonema minus TaxID=303371 RepID=A0A835YPP6_9STRA|nr:fucoxanthin chl a/c light-harvesting protein [Tribonema minus]KAG5181769.1 fucoxanthin chl a/c light-harvesting protein [Tribonema minus]
MVANATAALMAAATIATASAFVAPHTALPVAKATSSSALRMSSIGNEVMSESVPFLPRNPVLDEFELAGDVGFDPLNLAKDEKTLLFYRDAEVKHARLAMLAALGWVVSELFDGRLAAAANAPDLLVRPDGEGIGLAPSLLNGGLATIPAAYWLLVVGLTGALETQFAAITPGVVAQGREPGDYGFDPFNLWPQEKEAQKDLRTKELKNGRLAMIAIVAFAFQEAVSRVPVVEETPALFGLTPNEKIAEAEIGEVAAASFNVIEYFLHRLHLF